MSIPMTFRNFGGGFRGRRFPRNNRRMQTFAKKKSIKSINLFTNIAQAGGVNRDTNIFFSADDYSGGVGEVEVGSIMKWIYLEFYASYGNEIINSGVRIDWVLYKDPGDNFILGALPISTSEKNRRYVVAQGVFLLGKQSGGNVAQSSQGISRFVRIPKGLQRVGDQDGWNFVYRVTSINAFSFVGNFITKFEV